MTAELGADAARSGDEQHCRVKLRRSGKGNKPKERTCMKPARERRVAERDGAALVCRERAEESRAANFRERRRAWVLVHERAVRSTIAFGDERLESRWAKHLLAAEVSLAEAEFRVAEIRARPTAATQRTGHIPRMNY